MKTYIITFSLLVIFLFSQKGFGQSIVLTGRVLNSNTGEPIPFVSIGSLNSRLGTSSNISGEFVLKVDSLPQELFFSHLNYERRSIRILDNKLLILELKPASKLLDAIVVKGRKRSDYITSLVLKAYKKVMRESDTKYGKAFYRQIANTDSVFSELYEIFYDTRFSTAGILDWEIQEGRYAIGKTSLTNKNFSLLSRLWTTIQPATDDFIMPINPDVSKLYDFRVREVIKMGHRQVAVINFIPDESISGPVFTGDVYIDIDEYDILKVKGSIKDDRINFIKLSSDGQWKNYIIAYELSYRDDADSSLVLDYITVNQSFDYYLDNQFRFPVSTSSLLTFYDYYQPKKRKRLGGRIRFKASDAATLDRLGYNKEFWEENELVKRTPIEKKVIDSFEEQKAFGTIYLNNQKQIVLERKEILSDPLMNELVIKFGKASIYQEKAYLHLDKPYYTAGEDIWYSSYLVDAAEHRTGGGSGVLHVDLINPAGEIINNQAVKLVNGQGIGDIHLPNSLSTGQYKLRAHSNWMKNFNPDYFFNKELVIYNKKIEHKIKKEKDFNVKFYPEGGELVDGIISRVGLKAVDQNGRGIQVNGQIFDKEDNQIGNFKSNQLGMGSFFFNVTSPGYYARVKVDGVSKTFHLPEIQKSGFVIQVVNNLNNAIKIFVRGSSDYNESDFYLVGQSRGRIFYRGKGIINGGEEVIEIPKSNLPDGIFQITLFDREGRPRCERLVFINQQRGADVEIVSKSSSILSREQIDLNVKITDAEGAPVQGNFSIAVTDMKQISKRAEDENILSYFLLNSDIQGSIEQPGYYFINDEKETLKSLDMLMLTQGWRRFTWQDVLSGKTDQIKYPIEYGLTVSGIALNPIKSTPLSHKNLGFLILNKSSPIIDIVETDELGRFILPNLDFKDSTLAIISLVETEKNLPEAKVLITKRKIPITAVRKRNSMREIQWGMEVENYLKADAERKAIELAFSDNTKILSGVTVEADKQIFSKSIHAEADVVITPDDNIPYTDVFQMISGQVPGVIVTGNTDIRIRGSQGPPLIVIDGVPLYSLKYQSAIMSNTNSNSPNGNASVVNTIDNDLRALQPLREIPPSNIDRIEILKGNLAAIYGVFGGNGVIALYTKSGSAETYTSPNKNAFLVSLSGFYMAREFYSPQYAETLPEQVKPDRRATLFWDSNVRTDHTGAANISFYNSDRAKSFQIDIQGVTDTGELVNHLIILD